MAEKGKSDANEFIWSLQGGLDVSAAGLKEFGIKYNLAVHELGPIAPVLDLMRAHDETWVGDTEAEWMTGLYTEVKELSRALVGNHEDPPEWEVMQIAAIALNWLRTFYSPMEQRIAMRDRDRRRKREEGEQDG